MKLVMHTAILFVALSIYALAAHADTRMYMVSGVNLSVEDVGQGQPLLLIHGWGSSSHTWSRIVPTLSQEYRCISVDLMGYGGSDKPRIEDYTLERQTELLVALMDEMKLNNVVVAGHSYGGGVAMELAERYRGQRNRVSALVLFDTISYIRKLPVMMRPLKWKPVRVVGPRLVSKRYFAKRILKKAYYDDSKISKEMVGLYAEPYHDKDAIYALMETIEPLAPKEPIADFSAIDIPTLMLWGEHDTITPLSFGQRLSGEIEGVQFHVLENCGHMPQEELPEETLVLLREFLEELSSTASR